jgi:hypothetical protein
MANKRGIIKNLPSIRIMVPIKEITRKYAMFCRDRFLGTIENSYVNDI